MQLARLQWGMVAARLAHMWTDTLYPVVLMLMPYLVTGISGSLLEWIGTRAGIPGLIRVGKTLEALAADFPKAKANLTGKPTATEDVPTPRVDK